MLQKSLSKTHANSNPETTSTTNNSLPLPPSVQIVIDDHFNKLYAAMICFQEQLLPPVTAKNLADVKQHCEGFEQHRETMMQQLRTERARVHRATYNALAMDSNALGRELGLQCLMIWDVLLTIIFMQQQKDRQPGCWQFTDGLYHRIAEPLGNQIFQSLAAHRGTEETRLILSRAYSAFQFLKHKPKDFLLMGERFKVIFTTPDRLSRWSPKHAEEFRPHLERLRAIRAEDATTDTRRQDRERVKQVLCEVEGLRDPLQYEVKRVAKNIRYLSNRDAAKQQAREQVR